MKILLMFLSVCILIAPNVKAQGNLENPAVGGTESGISVISGWHCTANSITVEIDGVSIGKAGSGTSRGDTASVCGRSDTGFALLFNFNTLQPGSHLIKIYADAQLMDTRQFNSVQSAGAEFATGLSKVATISDFPSAGKETSLIWQQSKQGFVANGVTNSSSSSLNGTYKLTRASAIYLSSGYILDSQQAGIVVSGTMVINGNSINQSITLNANGQQVSVILNGKITDYGFYLKVVQNNGAISNIPLIKRGNEFISLTANSSFSEVDYWSRISTESALQVSEDSMTYSAKPSSQISIGAGLAALLLDVQ